MMSQPSTKPLFYSSGHDRKGPVFLSGTYHEISRRGFLHLVRSIALQSVNNTASVKIVNDGWE